VKTANFSTPDLFGAPLDVRDDVTREETSH